MNISKLFGNSFANKVFKSIHFNLMLLIRFTLINAEHDPAMKGSESLFNDATSSLISPLS